MPVKQKAIDIRLHADGWRMKKDDGTWVKPADYPPIDIAYNEVGLLKFKIIGSPKFAANPFVQKEDANPYHADFADQFSILAKTPKELLVIDLNQASGGGPYAGGNYAYELHFANDVDPLDPIITNNGCCRFVSNAEAVAYAVAFAALIPLAVIGYRRWRANRA